MREAGQSALELDCGLAWSLASPDTPRELWGRPCPSELVPPRGQQAWLLVPPVSQSLAPDSWGWDEGHNLLGTSGLGGPNRPRALSRERGIAQSGMPRPPTTEFCVIQACPLSPGGN